MPVRWVIKKLTVWSVKWQRFSSEQIHATLVENLRYAANMLMKEDILLLIEPINHFDLLVSISPELGRR